MTRPLLDFDDAGAEDDHPAKGVTVGDIRGWFDEVERLREQCAWEADARAKFVAEVERLKADNHRLMLWNEELQAKIDALERKP